MTRDGPPISACIIAKDEADRIGPCLASVAWCDEVLVLDSGSTDGTQALCREAGARVVETDWPGWVAQKNRAADEAAHDWVLSLDADERLDDQLAAALQEIRATRLAEPDGPKVYEVARKVWFLGRWLNHGGRFPEWRGRLFHRAHARWGRLDPHDRLLTEARTERVRRGVLEHYTVRTFDDFVAKQHQFSRVAAVARHERGQRARALDLRLRPAWRFAYGYFLRLGFLDGRAGYVAARLDAQMTFLKYAKLWDLARSGPR